MIDKLPKNTLIQATRILVIIGSEHPEMSYTQGHDRYVWVSLIVSIVFATQGGLPPIFSEAISYYLTYSFISINPISADIENFSKVESHFQVLDALVETEAPQTSALLKSVGHSSMHYALKWELTLFADEHNIHELMYIWDHILLHIDDIDDYVRCLCIGHIRQVPCTAMADEMAQAMQRNRIWDVPKLINNAEDILANMRGEISFYERIRMFCNCCL